LTRGVYNVLSCSVYIKMYFKCEVEINEGCILDLNNKFFELVNDRINIRDKFGL